MVPCKATTCRALGAFRIFGEASGIRVGAATRVVLVDVFAIIVRAASIGIIGAGLPFQATTSGRFDRAVSRFLDLKHAQVNGNRRGNTIFEHLVAGDRLDSDI